MSDMVQRAWDFDGELGRVTGPETLRSYDWIVVNTSAGKDSQAMAEVVIRQAEAEGVKERVVMVHACLGRAEWAGTRELAAEHAAHYGVRFEVVKREQDLLDAIRARGMWPAAKQRYCTSDWKRAPIDKLITRIVTDWRIAHQVGSAGLSVPCRVLNCMGLRADESPARAKKLPFEMDPRRSNGRRIVDNWLPIHDWSVGQVWETIRRAGTRPHPAYALGMPRLSCVFCVFAPEAALLLAGYHNRELLREYAQAEADMGHTFRQDTSLVQIEAKLAAGAVPGHVHNWVM